MSALYKIQLHSVSPFHQMVVTILLPVSHPHTQFNQQPGRFKQLTRLLENKRIDGCLANTEPVNVSEPI